MAGPLIEGFEVRRRFLVIHEADRIVQQVRGQPVPAGVLRCSSCHVHFWGSSACAVSRPRTLAHTAHPPMVQEVRGSEVHEAGAH